MDNMINNGKDMLKQQLKKKIFLMIAPAIPTLLIILISIVTVMLILGPIISALDKVEAFTSNVHEFFEKTGNWFSLRGFKIIDEKALEEREQELYDKLNDVFNEYLKHNVSLDAPLILSTIYYPMTNVYDEETIENMNVIETQADEDATDEQVAANKKLYDYYKKIESHIDNLAKHSISVTINEYQCVKKVGTDVDGNETTSYVIGDQVGTVGPNEFDGSFQSDENCDSTSNITKYIYQSSPAIYDEYLKTYIPDTKEYKFPTDLKDAEYDNKLQQMIYQVHDLSKMYYDIFDSFKTISTGFSSFCSTGVTIIGGDFEGVYSLEDYIAGVVSRENDYIDPNDPTNIESMKAQAIAARTYVINRTNNCSKSIENGQSAQAFSKSATEEAKRAASETAGMVLTYNGSIFSSEYDAYYCNEVAVCLAGGDCTCEYIKEPFIDASGKVTSNEKNAVNRHTVSMPTDKIRYGGTGHGRGMSQELANYLQSSQGYTYDKILEYFYADGVQIGKATGGGNGTDGAVEVKSGIFYVPPKTTPSGAPESKGTGPNGFNIYFWNLLSTFFDAARVAGYSIGYTDAWRSYDIQVSCYNDPKKIEADGNHLCTIPGTSLHGWGIAADLDYYGVKAATDWAHTHAAEFNLNFAVCKDYFGGVCSEPWHIEPAEVKRKDS